MAENTQENASMTSAAAEFMKAIENRCIFIEFFNIKYAIRR